MTSPLRTDRRPDPGERRPRRWSDAPSARTLSWLLVVAGALLVWPVDPLLAAEVAALGVILIAVGLGGALAAGSSTRRGRDEPPRR